MLYFRTWWQVCKVTHCWWRQHHAGVLSFPRGCTCMCVCVFCEYFQILGVGGYLRLVGGLRDAKHSLVLEMVLQKECLYCPEQHNPQPLWGTWGGWGRVWVGTHFQSCRTAWPVSFWMRMVFTRVFNCHEFSPLDLGLKTVRSYWNTNILITVTLTLYFLRLSENVGASLNSNWGQLVDPSDGAVGETPASCCRACQARNQKSLSGLPAVFQVLHQIAGLPACRARGSSWKGQARWHLTQCLTGAAEGDFKSLWQKGQFLQVA